jgi:hypothetical protein
MSIDTAAEPALSGEVVPYAPPALMEEYRPRIVMAPDEAKALAEQLQQCMRAILKEGVDYGPIPGGDPNKKNLNKPGAEKLLQWFGFGSESRLAEIERDDPDHPSGIADRARRIGVTYRTEITKTVQGGGKVVVATCEGYAGYDEDRYYISAEDAAAKAEAKERYWAAQDKRQPNPAKWGNASEYRAPWNTLVKMSQKRSYVGAAIDATGAAGLFTQDMEDVATRNAAPAALAEAGRAAIERLPVPVKQELNAWYRSLNWPGPDAWDAEQWCTALVKAGKLSVEAAPPKVPVPAEAREALREEPPAEAQKARAQQLARPPKQEKPQPAAEPPLPDGVDRIAQVFAERASKAMTAEDLTVILNEAAEVNKMDKRIREPGGEFIGTLRAYFTYCENSFQEPAGSAA